MSSSTLAACDPLSHLSVIIAAAIVPRDMLRGALQAGVYQCWMWEDVVYVKRSPGIASRKRSGLFCGYKYAELQKSIIHWNPMWWQKSCMMGKNKEEWTRKKGRQRGIIRAELWKKEEGCQFNYRIWGGRWLWLSHNGGPQALVLTEVVTGPGRAAFVRGDLGKEKAENGTECRRQAIDCGLTKEGICNCTALLIWAPEQLLMTKSRDAAILSVSFSMSSSIQQ